MPVLLNESGHFDCIQVSIHPAKSSLILLLTAVGLSVASVVYLAQIHVSFWGLLLIISIWLIRYVNDNRLIGIRINQDTWRLMYQDHSVESIKFERCLYRSKHGLMIAYRDIDDRKSHLILPCDSLDSEDYHLLLSYLWSKNTQPLV